ncbi:hypothetical protein AB0K18_13235 [Nonomuraea sp. NPDC049421]|uniref:hypothetical protein n=1 Tax=Nonomuraea sp. NPDC049421 TaxID=3155275 RepID=UPI00341CAB1B
MIRKLAWTAAAVIIALTGTAGASATTSGSAPIDNLAPGRFHEALDPLVGTWKVTKTNYVLSSKPIVSRGMGKRPTFDLYFTPPGQRERLIDRVVYTRRIE